MKSAFLKSIAFFAVTTMLSAQEPAPPQKDSRRDPAQARATNPGNQGGGGVRIATAGSSALRALFDPMRKAPRALITLNL